MDTEGQVWMSADQEVLYMPSEVKWTAWAIQDKIHSLIDYLIESNYLNLT